MRFPELAVDDAVRVIEVVTVVEEEFELIETFVRLRRLRNGEDLPCLIFRLDEVQTELDGVVEAGATGCTEFN